MKITLLSCNKLKNEPEADLQAEYIKRIPYSVNLIEIESKQRDETVQNTEENQKIAEYLDGFKGYKILMDETGKSFTSRQFASFIENKIQPITSEILFVIGGASGFNDENKSKADLLLCMGEMTWPHKLARVMLLEQIYRAISILNNHPYHKD